jgi:PPOX class probable F420-dependent enzyme
MLTDPQVSFIQAQRVGRLASADSECQPHVIPVCYAYDGQAFYIALDAKPKRVAPQALRRVRNILDNPRVALVIDRYSDDWLLLAYVLVRGTAQLLPIDDEAQRQAVALLRNRYTQYRTMPIHEQPVIAIRPLSVVAWGALDV